MGSRAVATMVCEFLLAGCGQSREASLEAQVKSLQVQPQQSQNQAQALRFERDGLRDRIGSATATAVQLNFSEVEGAAGDLDDRVQRVVSALGGGD